MACQDSWLPIARQTKRHMQGELVKGNAVFVRGMEKKSVCVSVCMFIRPCHVAPPAPRCGPLRNFYTGRLGCFGQGRTVDFKNCVVIMTSNLGSSYLMDNTEQSKRRSMVCVHRKGGRRPGGSVA